MVTSDLKFGGGCAPAEQRQQTENEGGQLHSRALTTESSHSPSSAQTSRRRSTLSSILAFRSLQAIDALRARPQRQACDTRRRHHHCDAGFAGFNAAQPMHHRDTPDGEAGRDFVADLGHHLHRHRLIALIVQKTGRPALGVRYGPRPRGLTKAPSSPRSKRRASARAVHRVAGEEPKKFPVARIRRISWVKPARMPR